MIKKILLNRLCTCEDGTRIFAVINVIFGAVSTVLSLIALFYFGVKMALFVKYTTEPTRTTGVESIWHLFSVIVCMLLTMASGTALIFARFLFYGIMEKKPNLLRTYFVYGVIVEVLSVLGNVSALEMAMDTVFKIEALWAVAISFGLLFLYSLILVMVRQTYLKYEEINNEFELYFGNKKLVPTFTSEKC